MLKGCGSIARWWDPLVKCFIPLHPPKLIGLYTDTYAQTYLNKNFQKYRNPEQFGNKNYHLDVVLFIWWMSSLFSGTIPRLTMIATLYLMLMMNSAFSHLLFRINLEGKHLLCSFHRWGSFNSETLNNLLQILSCWIINLRLNPKSSWLRAQIFPVLKWKFPFIPCLTIILLRN